MSTVENTYPIEEIGRSRGLASGQVHALVQGTDGAMWFAGPAGLARYDGTRIERIGKKEGLAVNGLRALALAADGNLWVGSDAGIDVVRPSGVVGQPPSGWRWGLVERIVPARGGVMWVAAQHGLVRWVPETGWVAPDHVALRDVLVSCAAIDGQGRLWVAGPRTGLMQLDNTWTAVGTSDVAGIGPIVALAAGRDESLIVAGEGGLVEVDSRGAAVRRLSDERGERVTAALVDGDELWIGVADELRHYVAEGARWRRVGVVRRRALVNELSLDRFGNLFVATDSAGVLKVSGMRRSIARPELPDACPIFSLRRLETGETLIGRERGAFRAARTREGGLTVDPIEWLDGEMVWDIVEEIDGTVWAATQTGLRTSGSNGASVRVGHDDPVLSAPARVLLRHAGGLWVGTLRGLAVVEGGAISHVLDGDGSQLGYVYTLTRDVAGVLWIGTLGRGLWRETPNGVVQVIAGPLSSRANVYAIAPRDDGAVAVLQDDQIVLVQPGGTSATEVVRSADPLAGWAAAFSSSGRLWVGSGGGLREYDLDAGELVREVSAWPGPGAWEFTTSRSLAIDEQGHLVCGLSSGLAIVDPEGLDVAGARPQVQLWRADCSGTESTYLDGVLTVREGAGSVEFQVFSPWFVEDGGVVFRHRLLGFERDWSPPVPNAQVGFSALPAGEYTLQVQAYSPLVGWGPPANVATVRVNSRGVAGLLGRVLERATGSARSRRRFVREHRELEQRVRERTLEVVALNRELERLSRTDALTGVANRRQFDEVLRREAIRANRDGGELALALVDIDHFKLFNDSKGHLAGDDCIRTVARELDAAVRIGVDTCARFGGEEFALVFPQSTGQAALTLCERLRMRIEGLAIPHESTDTGVITVSAGIAVLELDREGRLDEAERRLLSAADAALYAAKRSGRNRCVLDAGSRAA